MLGLRASVLCAAFAITTAQNCASDQLRPWLPQEKDLGYWVRQILRRSSHCAALGTLRRLGRRFRNSALAGRVAAVRCGLIRAYPGAWCDSAGDMEGLYVPSFSVSSVSVAT